MAEHLGGESFALEIIALKSGVPVTIRLKAICKRLLRAYQFKLARISETTPSLPVAVTNDEPRVGHADPQGE
jgi:hypothetical protein